MTETSEAFFQAIGCIEGTFIPGIEDRAKGLLLTPEGSEFQVSVKPGLLHYLQRHHNLSPGQPLPTGLRWSVYPKSVKEGSLILQLIRVVGDSYRWKPQEFKLRGILFQQDDQHSLLRIYRNRPNPKQPDKPPIYFYVRITGDFSEWQPGQALEVDARCEATELVAVEIKTVVLEVDAVTQKAIERIKKKIKRPTVSEESIKLDAAPEVGAEKARVDENHRQTQSPRKKKSKRTDTKSSPVEV